MAHLQQEVFDFKQLVVVDRHLEVFSRIWCVAELVQAFVSDVQQSVCMPSSSILDVDSEDFEVYWRLATLDVAECSASREEDKIAILARIPEDFNAQLQAAVLGERGLLCKHFDGFDELRAASLSVHRLRVAPMLSMASTVPEAEQ